MANKLTRKQIEAYRAELHDPNSIESRLCNMALRCLNYEQAEGDADAVLNDLSTICNQYHRSNVEWLRQHIRGLHQRAEAAESELEHAYDNWVEEVTQQKERIRQLEESKGWRTDVENVPPDIWVFVWARLKDGDLAEAPAVAMSHLDTGLWVLPDEDPWEQGINQADFNVTYWAPIRKPEPAQDEPADEGGDEAITYGELLEFIDGVAEALWGGERGWERYGWHYLLEQIRRALRAQRVPDEVKALPQQMRDAAKTCEKLADQNREKRNSDHEVSQELISEVSERASAVEAREWADELERAITRHDGGENE